ncbi:MAG TPA: hypothetical protein VJM15_07960 [Sphingomicrobium sp.]|nr:hypothetical protein [Sphingomicrobium sp.]
MHKRVIILGLAALAACKQDASPSPDNAANVSANAAAATKAPKRYCFFKKQDTKAWSASRDSAGNVTVKGKVRLDDARYRGDLGQPEVSGSSARLWVTMAPNTTGYASPDSWWDVSFTIPDSAAVETVTVGCDSERVVAELKLAKR